LINDLGLPHVAPLVCDEWGCYVLLPLGVRPPELMGWIWHGSGNAFGFEIVFMDFLAP
jgi:hypothetical protein